MGMAPPAVSELTHHLPGVVDAMSIAVITTQGAKVSHAHPIGAGDESMVSASSRVRPTHHLPGVVDATSIAVSTAQGANIGYCLAVEVDEV